MHSTPPPSIAPCVFCEIIAGRLPVTLVAADDLTLTFVDLRQAHEGHVLVIPRQHVADLRVADDATAVAVMRALARATRAVDRAFPSDGMSIWHSIGEGGNQEVPHLHFHVHPRVLADRLLEAYPSPPALPAREKLEEIGARVRAALD